MEPVQGTAAVHVSNESTEPARASPPRLGLTWLERAVATTMFAGASEIDLADIQEMARSVADALAGDDGEAARTRLVSREIALHKTLVDMLNAQVGIRFESGDERGALRADRLATSAARRLVWLLAEHRASCVLDRRTVIAIANAGIVNVKGNK